ncbi:molybdopterin-guanine dinucleotide biosynthesis protein B [Halovivax asiaticus JCM 14624]|uniref:Molybdopterin-guanine dinucleotide biosynthesis protein B n=1 Tax=Halovivax asiaticus JCM 14624 TaxID=1227490 RepID=M0BKE5_9EURY|nr:molybdopterin-guanine dinucleotide biosynthesis protein B [Halovivax asiaticus]ELZ10084.1 molybdopterin-guanine dinucleotide biosynthesis protein B [Halovivax asiaticus JCM 14624]
MKVLGIVGHSDAGKTTLLERLVPAFGSTTRVATVKSIHHDIELDTPGSDTHRHATAGAETVVGITPSRTFEIRRRPGGGESAAKLFALRNRLIRLRERDYDVVLVEGFHRARCPKLVVGERVPDETAPRVLAHVAGPDALDVQALVATVLSGEADERDG